MRFSVMLQTLGFLAVAVTAFVIAPLTHAQLTPGFIATTTLTLSICGNELVDDGEECDVLGETGGYSTTITGRQCDVDCDYGPYCGDAILQTIHGEECDDGNNDDGDFCAADCTVEVAGSGGGGSSGGGSSSSGGSDEDLGDTQVSSTGRGYPNQTVHVLLDAREDREQLSVYLVVKRRRDEIHLLLFEHEALVEG